MGESFTKLNLTPVFKPKQASLADKYINLLKEGEDLLARNKDLSTLSMDEFVFAMWVSRGKVGEKSTQHIVQLKMYGSSKLINLARVKVMGWEHFASFCY